MAKIRILQACNQLGIGGTEKSIQVFSKYLDRSRFEVFACGLRAGGPRAAELERLGVKVIIQPPDLDVLMRDLKVNVYHVYRAGDYEPGTRLLTARKRTAREGGAGRSRKEAVSRHRVAACGGGRRHSSPHRPSSPPCSRSLASRAGEGDGGPEGSQPKLPD